MFSSQYVFLTYTHTEIDDVHVFEERLKSRLPPRTKHYGCKYSTDGRTVYEVLVRFPETRSYSNMVEKFCFEELIGVYEAFKFEAPSYSPEEDWARSKRARIELDDRPKEHLFGTPFDTEKSIIEEIYEKIRDSRSPQDALEDALREAPAEVIRHYSSIKQFVGDKYLLMQVNNQRM